MAVRFCHTGGIWNAARQAGRSRMPLVVHVVLHSGSKPWAASRDFSTAIEGGEYYLRNAPELLPKLPIFIDDLAETSDEELLARGQSSGVTLALLAMKNARSGALVTALVKATRILATVDPLTLRQAVRHILLVDPQANIPVAGALKGSLGPTGQEIAMMIGEQLIEQGRLQGETTAEARETTTRRKANASAGCPALSLG